MFHRMGWQWSVGFMQPGPRHSNQRKMLRRGIGPQAIGSYNPLIEKTATNLMLSLQDFEGNPHHLLLR
jgi:cytochrome P450